MSVGKSPRDLIRSGVGSLQVPSGRQWLRSSGGPALPDQVLVWRASTQLLPPPPLCAANPDSAR